MTITLDTPGVDGLSDAVAALREWQYDGAPMQLHPGDLGWFWRFGAEATAAAVRTWSRDGRILAVGLQDGPGLLRMTIAPDSRQDDDLAQHLFEDLIEPARGVLPAGKASVEAPVGSRVRDRLSDAGWSVGEAWTPLRRDLTEPAERTGLRIEVIGFGQESEFTAVHRSAWDSERFTDQLWHTMVAGVPFTDARCLLAYDDDGVAVAGVTVWSAGPGRPGLIEPLGVHAAHRRRGYARSICVAAAAQLKELGSSSALVCTPSALSSAVATYKSAGYEARPEIHDLTRL